MTIPNDIVFPVRAWLGFDQEAFRYNMQRMRQVLPPGLHYISVLKGYLANLGSRLLVPILEEESVDWVAVATLSEAYAFRKASDCLSILVFGAFMPEEADYYGLLNLTASVSNLEQALQLQKSAQKQGQSISLHLKIDTGMGRQGIDYQQATHLYQQIAACPELKLNGVFTHFAHAHAYIDYTQQQRQAFLTALTQIQTFRHRLVRSESFDFEEVVRQYPRIMHTVDEPINSYRDSKSCFLQSSWLVHADNSAGVASCDFQDPFNAVRLGKLQFGWIPYEHPFYDQLKLKPTFSLHTRLGLVKNVKAGQKIGYELTHTLSRDSRLGLITMGYADGGLIPAMPPSAYVLVDGYACAFVGRVSMDQAVIDLTDLPHTPTIGTTVTLVGTQGQQTITLETFCSWVNKGFYEWMNSFGPRVKELSANA